MQQIMGHLHLLDTCIDSKTQTRSPPGEIRGIVGKNVPLAYLNISLTS